MLYAEPSGSPSQEGRELPMPAAVLWADMLQGNVNYQALWGEANPQPRVPRTLCTKADWHENLGSRIQPSRANVEGLICIPESEEVWRGRDTPAIRLPANPGPTNKCTTVRRMDRDTTPQWSHSSQEASFPFEYVHGK